MESRKMKTLILILLVFILKFTLCFEIPEEFDPYTEEDKLNEIYNQYL